MKLGVTTITSLGLNRWAGAGLLLLLPVIISLWAMTQLTGLPALPDCWTIPWNRSPSGTRLHCAQELSQRQTPEDLGRAIQLAHLIPADDPLRREADRFINQWATDLLRLGEMAFQDGHLEEAIAIAHQIPPGLALYDQAQAQCRQWQTIWTTAAAAYQEAETQVKQKNGAAALTTARRLLTVGNRYWATEQYQALMQAIDAAKQSPQPAVAKAKQPPVQTTLDWNQRQEQAAQRHLAVARERSKQGDRAALNASITEAQQVIYGTSHYEEAQAAIATWTAQLEMLEDRPQLDQAIQLAEAGDPDSLQAAIDAANQIGWGRALYNDARDRIATWRDQLTTLETQQRLEQLQDLAKTGHFVEPAVEMNRSSPNHPERDRSEPRAVEPEGLGRGAIAPLTSPTPSSDGSTP